MLNSPNSTWEGRNGAYLEQLNLLEQRVVWQDGQVIAEVARQGTLGNEEVNRQALADLQVLIADYEARVQDVRHYVDKEQGVDDNVHAALAQAEANIQQAKAAIGGAGANRAGLECSVSNQIGAKGDWQSVIAVLPTLTRRFHGILSDSNS